MNKTILIGLDGATFEVLDKFIENGTMQFLKNFIDNGVRAELISTPHPLTPPAFTTIATGRSPGNHGIFDFFYAEEKEGVPFFRLYDSRDIQCETVWEIASNHNKKVILLNFVLTAPPIPISGYIVPGMVHWKHLRRHVYPSELYEELKNLDWFDAKKITWDFKHMEKAIVGLPKEEYKEWIIYNMEREKQWFNVLSYLMKQKEADLISIVFDGIDKIQHICWEFLDTNYISSNFSDIDKEINHLLIEFFKEFDKFLQRIVEMAGPESRIFIVSDHGFGPSYIKFRINQFLSELGYSEWEKDKNGKIVGEGESINDRLNLNWRKTIAYTPTRSSNGVFIRIAKNPGEPGILEKDYNSFRNKLVKQLLDVKDPKTGTHIVKNILLREKVFSGKVMNRAPDITIVLCDYGNVFILSGNPIVEHRQISGTHYPEGIFIAKGLGIKKGIKLEPFSLLDIAPLILYSLDIPIPENFEGKVNPDIFEKDYISGHPVNIGSSAKEKNWFGSEKEEFYKDEEKKDIEERLRALGYID